MKITSLASAALVALSLTSGATAAASGRALLAEAAPSPMAAPMPMAGMAPAMPAAAPMAMPAASNADLTLAAEAISFKNGKLTIKDPSDTLIKRNGRAIGLASTAATFGAGTKVNAPAEAAILGMAPDGTPLTAVARLSNPMMSDDDELTFDAVILGAPDSDGGSVAATAAAAKGGLVPAGTASFKAGGQAALVWDGADAAGAAGDKSIVGAVVGAGVGAAVCGPWCGAGGALTGAWWF